MYKSKRISIPIYESYLEVCICDDTKEFNIKNKSDVNVPDLFAFQVNLDKKINGNMRTVFFVVFNPNKNISDTDFVHESFHAVTELLSGIGSKPDVDNQEPYAYLQAWMFKQIKNTYTELISSLKKDAKTD